MMNNRILEWPYLIRLLVALGIQALVIVPALILYALGHIPLKFVWIVSLLGWVLSTIPPVERAYQRGRSGATMVPHRKRGHGGDISLLPLRSGFLATGICLLLGLAGILVIGEILAQVAGRFDWTGPNYYIAQIITFCVPWLLLATFGPRYAYRLGVRTCRPGPEKEP